MQFTKLQITGFKSFVDHTELLIEPGLTGVVGPNGCGKSNLVEALRWVMGESSARQMRGGEMDDVIFGGTSTRPSRNLAQVMLSVDNTDRRAPATFNVGDDLEIARSIARGHGSTYKVNGKEVRARDVQLLFADVASGAHSPSMVSQGRVGSLINAKPSDRRAILEDAAGIAGLHSRRHEAELRLAAADTNLTRVDDVLATLDVQRQALARQAKQAARYRTISEQIRTVEASLLAVQWVSAEQARATGAEALMRADEIVTEMVTRSASAAEAQATSAAGLPGLRDQATEAGAALQKLVSAAGELDAETRRIEQATRTVGERLAELERDAAREIELGRDAGATVERLEQEAAVLEASRQGEQVLKDEAATAVERASAAVERVEAEWATLSSQVAAEEARRTALDRRIAELEQRARRLIEEAARVEADRAKLLADGDPAEKIASGEAAVAQASSALEQAQASVRAASERRQTSQSAEAAAVKALQESDGTLARLKGEIAGISASLTQSTDKRSGAPILDQVTAEAGFEAALGAALGDDLLAPLRVAGDEKLGWAELPDLAAVALPDGSVRLADHVQAPSALQRRLRAVGLVETVEDGFRLWPSLVTGQRLVSRGGDLWRWDGFHRAAGAKHATAVRLVQRNRLTELEKAKADAEAARVSLDQALGKARAEVAASHEAERTARQAENATTASLNTLRTQHSRLVNDAAAARAKLAGLDGSATRIATDRAEIDKTLAEARASAAEAPNLDAARADVAARRAQATERRTELAEAKSQLDRLARETEERARRLAGIANELIGWRARSTATTERLDEFKRRRLAAEAEAETLKAQPAQIARQRATLVDQIEQAEAARKLATDRLVISETQLSQQDAALKAAEREVASAREARIRVEAELQQAIRHAQEVAERIRQKLDCRPDQVRAVAEIEEGTELPAADILSGKLDRLSRERENLGAVNLRAETEAEEVEKQITDLENEKADLTNAIAKLRTAIANLNREGKEKLVASFEVVNKHFQDLFVRLFGGGRATLELTESEDPLAAGLEIFASPPGKKLQTLTLLSGGEQALTALALIFAVFLTNPSPICVLDEVDAPLDDSNVERFCTLLAEIAESTGTRFLVVTHHRMTMTRMDRLFGVTMAERGISQLVSVDLVRADRIRATA